MFVRLQDFKCFSDTGDIEIKPITLLIGENSTGKTSFMAALRILLEWGNGADLNPFNRSPYFLGGFDQISHATSDRRSKKNSFSLSLKHTLAIREQPESAYSQGDLFMTSLHPNSSPVETFVHKLSFEKGASQPELMEYAFSIGSDSVELDFHDEWVKFKFTGQNLDASQTDEQSKDRDPSSLFRQNGRFLRYIFFSLTRGVRQIHETRSGQKLISKAEINQFSRKFEAASTLMAQTVFASAPVRSEPQRTYNPSEVVADSEGSSVPLELAGAKTRSAEKWRKIRASLSEFGRAAGLFEDIDVRQLGKKDGDPFQIHVKVGGPMVNLIDVGYGVSQALPIIYQVQNQNRYSAFFLQQPEVHLHPRAQAELGTLVGKIANSKKRPHFVIETHSDYITNRICIDVRDKKIDPKDVRILYFSREGRQVKISSIDIDERGQLVGAPQNFKAFFLEEQRRFLGL